MFGAAVFVGADGVISAAHTVSEDTEEAWKEAIDFLLEARHNRYLHRLIAPDSTASFTLSTRIDDLLASGWTQRTARTEAEGQGRLAV